MSFKSLILFTLVLLLGACGVKGPPEIPPGTAIPSYIDKFTNDSESATQTQP